MAVFAFLVLVVVQLVCCSDVASASTYNERLLLKPLPQAALLASFNFRSKAVFSSFQAQNFNYFPRALGQILLHAHTKELHLRFSTGRWDAQTWGGRPWGGSREGGTGVELWAWVEAQDEQEADERWLILTNALSGLFCASINFVDSARTIRPILTFTAEGHHVNNSSLHLLHGTLPNEVVCTENLTPFLKLLPCKGKAGISSLLDGHKLFDASWQSMAIDVRPSLDVSANLSYIEVEQTIDMVVDIERSRRSREDPIPRPVPLEKLLCNVSKTYSQFGDSCYPLDRPSMPAFGISEVFGRPVKGTCPLADDGQDAPGTLCVDIHPERQITPLGQTVSTETRIGDNLRCFNMSAGSNFDMAFSAMESLSAEALDLNMPLIKRTLTGRGQQHGGLHTIFTNPSSTKPLRFVFLESLPWFMKPHFHTLKTVITPLQSHTPSTKQNTIAQMFYQPALDRQRSSHLELVLEVPASSTLTLSYDFEKAILRYTEYPPDANRGFDVAPAVVRLLHNTTASPNVYTTIDSSPLYIRTTSLLLYLPTPDFSMPYNTIILTSTVIALAFGSIYNILVRRFVAANEVPKSGSFKDKITRKISAYKARFSSKSKAE